jgi:hypothetical protein
LYSFGKNAYGQFGNPSSIDTGTLTKQITETKVQYIPTEIGIDVDDILGFDCYWKQFIKYDWTAVIKKSNIAGFPYQLTLISNNETLQFTANLKLSSGSIYKNENFTLKGLYFSTVVRGKTHNIIIPTINIYIEYNSSAGTLFLSLFEKSSNNTVNEWSDTTYSASNCVNYSLISSNQVRDTYFTKELRWSAGIGSDPTSSAPACYKMRWANISPIKTVNEFGYPVSYLSLNHLGFSSDDSFSSNDNYGIDTDNKIFEGTNDGQKPIYDLERYVKPFDISTNLLYYKGMSQDRFNDELTGKIDTIKDTDEVVIINARKLYNKVPDDLQKPSDANLSLKFNEFFAKEITLTGFIPVTSTDDPFIEVYPYRNANFEYAISSSFSSTGIPNYAYPCRYTDYKSAASQFKLFKLNKEIVFTTTDDFRLNFGANLNIDDETLSSSLFDQESECNKDEIPCKMSLVLDDLYFKQEIRRGISNDNISDITYSKRLFYTDIANSTIRDRWGMEKSPNIKAPSGANSTALEVKTSPYYQIKDVASYTSANMYGGSSFYNNIHDLNIISNAVNKWETVPHESKYSDLYIFSDCYPSTNVFKNGKYFGTPYCNLSGIQLVQINFSFET